MTLEGVDLLFAVAQWPEKRDGAGAVEDVGGIEIPLRPFVRHAAADDVDIQLL